MLIKEKRITSDRIVSEIENKVNSLDRRHCIFCFAMSRFNHYLIKHESSSHSYKIENPDSSFISNKVSRKNIKKGAQRISRALVYAREFVKKNKVDELLIKGLAAFIDPELHGFSAEYRLGPVRPDGATWTPPYHSKIDSEMKEFVSELNELLTKNDIADTLEASSYAHLHLVRIHPFSDTNGRTSRVLQNAILESRGLPPLIIYAGERQDYFSHLDHAINSWRERTGDPSFKFNDNTGEKDLYNYFAGKVSASLDRLMGYNM